MNYFDYREGFDIIGEDTFKISPSRLSGFFDQTSGWWRENVLGEDAVFQGNTNSCLGTVVHGMAEMYHKEGILDYSKAEAYIRTLDDRPDIDTAYIRSQMVAMTEALIFQYLKGKTDNSKSEVFLHHFLADGIAVAGTADLILPNRVVDYKTTNAMNPPDRVPRGYWFQQMCYVYMLRMQGHDIRAFELVYVTHNNTGRISEKTGKPMKDYPSTCGSVIHEVTDDDIIIIENSLNLVKESFQHYMEHPEHLYLLAQDMRLKQKDKPILFT